MRNTFLAAVMAVTLSACGSVTTLLDGDLSLLEDVADTAKTVEDHTLGNALKALPKYCKLPARARNAFRDRVNERPEGQGNQMGIWCKGDPALTLGQ